MCASKFDSDFQGLVLLNCFVLFELLLLCIQSVTNSVYKPVLDFRAGGYDGKICFCDGFFKFWIFGGAGSFTVSALLSIGMCGGKG